MRLRGIVVLLVPLLAACGRGGEGRPPGSPDDAVRAAATTTVGAESARMTLDVRTEHLVVVGEGVASLREARAETRTLMGSNAREAMPDVGFVLETRTIGEAVYVRKGFAGTTFDWSHKITAKEAASQEGAAVLPRAAWLRLGPTVPIAHLYGATGFRVDGSEKVRGAVTMRYEGTLDLAKARDAAPEPRLRDAIAAEIEELGATTVPATVWVDGRGRVRRMRQVLDLSRSTNHDGWAPVTATFELYDFGTAVDVAVPPEG